MAGKVIQVNPGSEVRQTVELPLLGKFNAMKPAICSSDRHSTQKSRYRRDRKASANRGAGVVPAACRNTGRGQISAPDGDGQRRRENGRRHQHRSQCRCINIVPWAEAREPSHPKGPGNGYISRSAENGLLFGRHPRMQRPEI